MLELILSLIRGSLRTRQSLILENLALRHQVQVLRRGQRRPRLKDRDRVLWILLRRLWSGWRRHVLIVQPDTVVRWHRSGFRAYWRRKSRGRRPGRPRLRREERETIERMAADNPRWGTPRLHGELLKLGIEISEGTVAKYARRTGPPSQTWRAFLENHARETVSMDVLTVPTITGRVLYVLLMVEHARRRVVHCAVTAHPTMEWAAGQLRDAFPWGTAPRYLLRDRDRIYGSVFQKTARTLGIEEFLTAHRCPWQNPYAERLVGTVRRECLDHVIIFREEHLRRVLREFVRYYNEDRTHLSLAKDCPIPREVESPEAGSIRKRAVLGGLHHRYYREAA